MNELKTLVVNGQKYQIIDADAVRSVPQNLEEEEKAQAKRNIGVQDYYSTKREEMLIPLYGGGTMNKTNITTDNVIKAYDKLVEDHIGKITKNILYSDDNLPIVEYVISTGEYNTEGEHIPVDADIKKPKYLVMSGIHGREQSAIISTYKFICDVLNGYNIPSHFKEGSVIHVLPVGNPYSVYTILDSNGNVVSCGQRTNENNVNIDRNFDWHWKESTAAQNNNGNNSGSHAASEVETQVIAKWLNDNRDADLFIDVHNSGYINEIANILGLEDHVKRLALRGLDRVVAYWRNTLELTEYEMSKGTGDTTGTKPVIYSYSSSYNPNGTSCCYATDKLGIPSIVLELSAHVDGKNSELYPGYDKDSNPHINSIHPHNPATHATGAETIGNILLEFFANPGTARRDVFAMLERTAWLQSCMLANMDEVEKTFNEIIEAQSPMIGGTEE